MNTKNKSDNWQAEAPRLAQMEKINPYQVPEGYFDTLSSRIQTRIETLDSQKENNRMVKIIPVWMRYAAAACLTLAFGITLYLNNKPEGVNFDEISDREIVVYLENNMDETDMQLIFDKLDDEQKTITENLNEQELETYLYQNL